MTDEREWRREWNRLRAGEQDFFRSHKKKTQNPLNSKVEEKMPENMQEILEKAFRKAFALIFEKGTEVIEKTYPKDKIREQYHGRLGDFRRGAERSRSVHLAVSAVEGSVLGALGIGVPDIPVFCAVMLRGIYEIAEHYGCSHDGTEEKIFILKLMENAMSYGEDLRGKDRQLNDFAEKKAKGEDAGWREDLTEQIERTADCLAEQLLYMKFLQTIPVVGVVGGAVDVWCMQQVSAYAQLKYQRRFLLRGRAPEEPRK